MKMKYKIIFAILLTIIIFLIGFFNSKKVIINVKTKEMNKIEINQKIYNTDIIKKIKNGKLVTSKKLIDTSKKGKKKIEIKVKNYFGKIEKHNFNIKIIDTEKPKITYNKNIEITKGEEIDLLKDVSAEDNSKETIKVTVEGEYDNNKPGTYELHYIAKDSSGNTAKEPFTLTVKEQVNEEAKQETNTNSNSTFKTSKGFTGTVKNGITYIDGYLIANKSYSLPSNYNPGLDQTVKNAAEKMFSAAAVEGITGMYIGSGFRSYSTQNTLYNNYVTRDGKDAADTYSARPGHSEHQTGLAFDICVPGYDCISSGFNNTPPANWLANNAHKYGFILRYPQNKTNETGYIYESWHFRYVGEDLASKLYNNGNWITMESYFGITSEYK